MDKRGEKALGKQCTSDEIFDKKYSCGPKYETHSPPPAFLKKKKKTAHYKAFLTHMLAAGMKGSVAYDMGACM